MPVETIQREYKESNWKTMPQEKLNMNYSGTISLNKIERPLDIYYIKNARYPLL